MGAPERNDLLELLDDRIGSRSTLITSQLPVKDWHTYLNDPTLADAILDRVVHSSHKIVLKATKVDGVYTADPKKDPQAQRYHRISFDEAIGRNLAVLDATAFALCRDQKLPINVFSIFKAGALKRVVMGEDEGTLVHS